MAMSRLPARIAPLSLLLALASAPGVNAQNRVVLPEGTVILVRTTDMLESSNARVGQTFGTTVIDTVRVDAYTVIPAGSRITGTVTSAQAATRQQSGVMEVAFNRLTLPDGTSYPFQGKLTSTDANERRQIENDPNARVVLVGGRGGIGAAIAAAGGQGAAGGILGALGSIFSEGQDVRVPAGTTLAVQLQQRLALNRRGGARAPDLYTIYTAPEMIRAAQLALARQNYYNGGIHGQLDEATQRALFEYQAAHGIIATGNLDGRTAQALGVGSSTLASAAVLSPQVASMVRQGAQALAARERQDLGITTSGRLDTRRSYAESDFELWFALSAFADNAALYEQMIRNSASVDGTAMASRALLVAAHEVDSALQQARTTNQVQSAWSSIRAQIATLDAAYTYR